MMRKIGGIMLRNVLLWIILLGAVGLAAGYFIFARVGSSYVPLQLLLEKDPHNVANWLGAALALRSLDVAATLQHIRMNILYSGLVGAGVGLVASILARPTRRR